jgi:hypothetical protein
MYHHHHHHPVPSITKRERGRKNTLIKSGGWVPTSSGKRIKERKR